MWRRSRGSYDWARQVGKQVVGGMPVQSRGKELLILRATYPCNPSAIIVVMYIADHIISIGIFA
jgi:hypothetical protein